MKLTADQKAERESVKRFMEVIASDGSAFDLKASCALHHESLCGTAQAVESHMKRIMWEAMESGDMHVLSNVAHISIMNGLMMGFLLGREYQKRAQDCDTLERMFGDAAQPEKPKRKRKGTVE
jgi:hypothetical protein